MTCALFCFDPFCIHHKKQDFRLKTGPRATVVSTPSTAEITRQTQASRHAKHHSTPPAARSPHTQQLPQQPLRDPHPPQGMPEIPLVSTNVNDLPASPADAALTTNDQASARHPHADPSGPNPASVGADRHRCHASAATLQDATNLNTLNAPSPRSHRHRLPTPPAQALSEASADADRQSSANTRPSKTSPTPPDNFASAHLCPADIMPVAGSDCEHFRAEIPLLFDFQRRLWAEIPQSDPSIRQPYPRGKHPLPPRLTNFPDLPPLRPPSNPPSGT